VIEPVAKPQPAPEPVAAEPDALPQPQPEPAAFAPEPDALAAEPDPTTPATPAFQQSRSDADIPVDFNVSEEPVHSALQEEESEPNPPEGEESAYLPEEDRPHTLDSAGLNEPPPTSEADEMNKRSGQAEDFSGDFGFLNTVATTPQQAGPIPAPESNQSDSSAAPESNPVVADSESADPVINSTPATITTPVSMSSGGRASATSATSSDSTATADAVDSSSAPTRRGNTIPVPAWFPGFTAALLIIVLFLLFTGRIHLSADHVLESLPDVRTLAPGEFQEVKASIAVPPGHVLALGESRRFGDVLVTPVKVTREPLEFQDFLTGKLVPSLTTPPALKLHLRFQNVSRKMAFPPYDAALMSHRFPPFSNDLNTLANSFLAEVTLAAEEFPERLLNYMQTMDNNFVLIGQNAGKVVAPGETLETYVASEPVPDDWNPTGRLRWRVQFRKGVHHKSKNGVTTLIDVHFNVTDIGS